MSEVAELASGKGHKNENFPVASVLIHPRHRAPILAFYRFARAADDVADHESSAPEEKLRLLDGMLQSLTTSGNASPEAAALREVLRDHNLTTRHAADLLEAFRRDVTKLRYENWDELMDYCRYSAMPVGRFVLDVHGESRNTWPASDALCAALQVINHLQDCAKDYRNLNRVYIPRDALDRAHLTVDSLGAAKATPALRGVITDLAHRNATLLAQSAPFAQSIKDTRLGLEVAVIQKLAENLNTRLLTRDPLSDRVHHSKPEALGLALLAAAGFFLRRIRPGRAS